MSDNPNNNNIKNAKIKTKEQTPIYKNIFLNESETISTYILEKIISYSITEALKNRINKLMPNFCYNQLYETLSILSHMDFITYDKDDLMPKPNILSKKMNSSKNILSNIDIGIHDPFKEMNNSEIIRKYKLNKEYDPNESVDSIDIHISNIDNSEKEKDKDKDKDKIKEEETKEDKNILGILIREGYKDISNSFQKEEFKKEQKREKYNIKHNYNLAEDRNKIIKEIYNSTNSNLKSTKEVEPFHLSPDEKIEEIKTVESHKIDILKNSININNPNNIIFASSNSKSLPFEKVVESNNFWRPILQPNPPPIDRDAGTKIKFEKPFISKFSKKTISKMISEEKPLIPEQNRPNEKIIDTTQKKKKIRLKYNAYNTNNNQNRNKKKKVVELPFDSTDIEPKKLETYKELDEIASLRGSIEKAIQDKKKEKEHLAKIEKEKKAKLEAIEDLRKELYRKNVTVDVKGDIVYIKPIDMKKLIEEFNKGKANFKNIKILETEPKYKLDNNEIKVEKNPFDFSKEDLPEEKTKKSRKKKLMQYLVQKSTNSNSNNSNNDANKKKKTPMDKGDKFISGSNFAIINPEIGVNITENKNTKYGGKDFYKKFNKFSIEVFREQLSKTSNNFFNNLLERNEPNDNNIIETNKTERIFNKENIGNILEYKNKNKNKNSISPNQTLYRNKNEEKNSLSLKTKNLKIALQDLDLITDREINVLNKTKKFKKEKFLSKILNTSKSSKKTYNDMNKFAQTLVGKDNWGLGQLTEREKYTGYKIPKKPENLELKRELPQNMLKHMPRKRLPPINTVIKLKTMAGFFTERKIKKKKEINKENMDNKEKEENKENK